MKHKCQRYYSGNWSKEIINFLERPWQFFPHCIAITGITWSSTREKKSAANENQFRWDIILWEQRTKHTTKKVNILQRSSKAIFSRRKKKSKDETLHWPNDK